MLVNQKIILAFCYLFILLPVYAQQDSTDTDHEEDCTTNFFERSEIVKSPAKIILVNKSGKTMTMASFLKAQTYADIQHGLADLDNDGKKELIINDYTGGAHCCDEFFIFKNISTNKYQYVAKTFAGDVCVTNKNEFLYNFYELFGYFFTCYACAYEDTSDMAPAPLHNIVLKYNKGKLSVVPGDKELRSQIIDNLSILGEQPYQKLEREIDQDNGLRKEFAINLAVFYYSFGRNMIETKKLFDKYYKYADAKKVWAQFSTQLQFIRKDNDF
jgi:hypothetical protein